MNKSIRIASLFAAALALSVAAIAQPAAPEPFESNYPTYVLSCSNVQPAPFEDCYPVAITPMKLSAAPATSPEPFESNYPEWTLVCSDAKPEPFENCYPVMLKK